MYYDSKMNTSINNLEDIDVLFLQGIRFNIFSSTPSINPSFDYLKGFNWVNIK